jgi:hypothetical protein
MSAPNQWLADALINRPLNNGTNSNIRRIHSGPPPPAAATTRLTREIGPEDQDTESLTLYLLRRTGRVKTEEETMPFRVTVRFTDGEWYEGLLSLDSNGPHVAKIMFDDGEIHYYSQKDLYMEVAGC